MKLLAVPQWLRDGWQGLAHPDSRRTREALLLITSANPPDDKYQAAYAVLDEVLAEAQVDAAHSRKLARASRVYRVEAGDHTAMVWKPGEVMAAREVAAYRLDRRLGHMCRVLPVARRELDGKSGALTMFVTHARAAHLDARSTYVLQCPERPSYYRVAVLDCLIGNRDRHSGNWLLTDGGTVIPIDYGGAFPSHNGPQRCRAYDFWHKVAILPGDREKLGQLLEQQDSWRDELSGLVGHEAVGALLERLRQMVEHGRTYDWHSGTFPVLADPLKIKDTFQARFVSHTGLEQTRPGHHIRLSDPDDYKTLMQHIEVHRYYLCLQRNADVSFDEASASWYDTVYRSAAEAIQEVGLDKEFPRKTQADLYLWLCYHRERIRALKGWMPSDRYVACYLAERFSGRTWGRIWKTLGRSVRAAMQAAAESPEPPENEEKET